MGREARARGAPGDGRLQRAAAAAAFASTAIGFAGVAAAVAMSPWFSWTANALSDLGHPRRDSWVVFGACLAVAGALYVLFAVGVTAPLPRGTSAAAARVLMVGGGLSLAGVGVFNESFEGLHLFVSATYFALPPLGMAFLARALRPAAAPYARLTLAVALGAAAFDLSIVASMTVRVPFTSQAVPELLASVLLAGWALWTALLMARGTFPPAAAPARAG